MHIPAKDVAAGKFFVTADAPPGNVWIMRIQPGPTGEPTGLCQNVNDEEYWEIKGDRLVRLLREDEYDQTTFRI